MESTNHNLSASYEGFQSRGSTISLHPNLISLFRVVHACANFAYKGLNRVAVARRGLEVGLSSRQCWALNGVQYGAGKRAASPAALLHGLGVELHQTFSPKAALFPAILSPCTKKFRFSISLLFWSIPILLP